MIRKLPTKPTIKKGSSAQPGKPEVRLFISYSHKDEAARDKLDTHLAQVKRDDVSTWFDGDLDAGEALDPNLARQLRRAHVFVALLSPDYLASKYCWETEYKRAMARRGRGTMRVVAVLVRPCDWRNTRAARFKLLPKDGRPASEWRPTDKAYLDAANGIREVVKAVRSDLMAGPPEPLRAGKRAKPVAAPLKPQKPRSPSAKRAPAKRPITRPKKQPG